MCWSAQVAAAFTAAELAALALLCLRNRYFDRANALFHLPFVAQEGLQAVLWLTIDGKTGDRECSANNRFLSWALACVIMGLPFWSSLVSHLQRLILFPLPQGASPWWWLGLSRRLLGLRGAWTDEWQRHRVPAYLDAIRLGLLMWGFIVLGGGSANMIARNLDWGDPSVQFDDGDYSVRSMLHWFFAGPYCTTAGPNGHQVLPFVVFSHWVMKLGIVCAYFSIFSGFNLLGRPSFAFSALSVCGLPSALALYLLLGDEAGSVWCWTASMACAVYLVEPLLIDHYRALDPLMLQPTVESDERRRAAGLGFLLAWKHCPQDLLPWAELVRSQAAELEQVDGDEDYEVAVSADTLKMLGPPAAGAVPAPMRMA